jgi:hypothetical protein
VRTPIDAFILEKLRSQHLNPAPEADRFTLIRRATFDLHGLPPTVEQVLAFANNPAPDAYEKLIDELLQSPRYGEKWGRHWLDLVRYGDTSGFESDPYLLYAWRYRDYVIKSFNDDKPYDRFVKEQIAGDEIFPDDPVSQAGTGYFTVGPNRDMLFKVEDINRVETLTDFVDTTSSVFLGLTVGCARCHDHKFDPIPQRDYYRLQAIFAPAVKTRIFLDYNGARFYDLEENTRQVKLAEIGEEIARIQAPYRKKLYEEKLASFPGEVREAFITEESQRTVEQRQIVNANNKLVKISDEATRATMSKEDTRRVDLIAKRLVEMFANFKLGPFAPGVTDAGQEAPATYLPVRGRSGLGERVRPGLPSALGGGNISEPSAEATSTGRRRALAEWIATPDNPLTARVMVNRLWQFHFGRGIVASPSDFGSRCVGPSHPELLDWLATEFVVQGWSLKQMHRLIMTSSVYRQASTASPEATRQDPENVYLSHSNRHRLLSEEIRDAILQAAGVLNLKMGGRPVIPPLRSEELYGMSLPPDVAWIVTTDPTEYSRRSVYLFSRRAFRQPMFEVFDSPDGVMHCSRRDSSTTAPQSLTLFNSDFTVEQAKNLSGRLLRNLGGKFSNRAEVIAAAWRQVLARDPSADEIAAARTFLDRQAQILGSEVAAVTELCRALINSNEFLYVD